jgi:hypothetical protein
MARTRGATGARAETAEGPKPWSSETRNEWTERIAEGRWAEALEMANSDGFHAGELERRQGSPKGGSSSDRWAEIEWFSRCGEQAACERLCELAIARPLQIGPGRRVEAPGPNALGAALAAGNEAALRALRNVCPGLFEGAKLAAALSVGIGLLCEQPRWTQAGEAGALRARFADFEREIPNFSAQMALAQWASPEVCGEMVFANGGRAACLRIALEEGLDPRATRPIGESGEAPMALEALDCANPDVFFEFLRAGASPDELLAMRHGGASKVFAFWPAGVFGVEWHEIRWPDELSEKARARRGPAVFSDPRAIERERMMRGATLDVVGASAREIIEAGVGAGLGATFHGERVVERQRLWKAAWEAWQLGEALRQPKGSVGAIAESAAERPSEPSAGRRGQRL